MTNKPGACNPEQKGERRQRLHKNQNNEGNPQKKSNDECLQSSIKNNKQL
ncbi:MAG: clostri-philic family protein [Clostridium sp.]